MTHQKIFCPKCGNEHTHEGVFCNYCGTNIESVLPESRKLKSSIENQIAVSPSSLQQKIDNTFFCPKCRSENLKTNPICKICGEEFGKFDFIDSSEEFARIKDKKKPLKEKYNPSPFMIVVYILGAIAFIVVLSFLIAFMVEFGS